MDCLETCADQGLIRGAARPSTFDGELFVGVGRAHQMTTSAGRDAPSGPEIVSEDGRPRPVDTIDGILAPGGTPLNVLSDGMEDADITVLRDSTARVAT